MMQGEVQMQPTDSQNLSGSDDEIKAEDVESGSPSSPCCRICLEKDDGGDELISPCMCKGTQKFVHRSCLDHWRKVKGGFAFSNCTTCKSQFNLPGVKPFNGNNAWQRLIDAWWVFLMFLIMQPTVAVVAGFAYMMDRDGHFRNSFKNEPVRMLAEHPIPFYYCIGFVITFGVIGFFALIAQFI